MQKYVNLKHVALLLGLLLPAVWCGARAFGSMDGHSHINIKEGNVQGLPKGSTIHAAINGHLLMVTFTENLAHLSSLHLKSYQSMTHSWKALPVLMIHSSCFLPPCKII